MLLIAGFRRISPQIVLKREIVESIANTDNPEWQKRIAEHKKKYPDDPLPIPFNDPEPQLMIPYHKDYPWHVQIHRDAFSYGEVGPKADPRVVVDLRFFGKSDVVETNKVIFSPIVETTTGWRPGATDIYGMPQATVSSPSTTSGSSNRTSAPSLKLLEPTQTETVTSSMFFCYCFVKYSTTSLARKDDEGYDRGR